jgi:Ca2+-binding RTX toxin-like protein
VKKALALALVALCALPAAAQAGTWTRESTTPITVPDGSVGTPYPSTIAVQDLPGQITKVTATLRGVFHTSGGDLDIAAAAPNGQAVVLMSDRCVGNIGAPRNLTFDDAAALSLGNLAPDCGAGTYKPTNAGALDTYPAPGPTAPAETLSAFNGISPNGNWSLFTVDDNVGSSGGVNAGWSLTITTDQPAGDCAGRQGTIFGTDGSDDLVGTEGDDVFLGIGGRDEIRGLGGADVVCGGDGNDRLIGGAGKDRLVGEAGGDRLLGGKGKDRLLGGAGKDVLKGGKGKDVLKGGGGKDQEKD